jgi:hypothetical protein
MLFFDFSEEITIEGWNEGDICLFEAGLLPSSFI